MPLYRQLVFTSRIYLAAWELVSFMLVLVSNETKSSYETNDGLKHVMVNYHTADITGWKDVPYIDLSLTQLIPLPLFSMHS